MASRRLLWLLLLGLGLALLALVIRHDDGTIAGLETHDFASLTIYAALLIFFGGFIVAMFRHRFREALEAALFWVVIALFLAAGYSYRAELREVGERIIAELVPGRPVVRGMMVEIARGRGGEFRVATQVNGAQVAMVLSSIPGRARWC